jgi:AcrR family transcriptional regulator
MAATKHEAREAAGAHSSASTRGGTLGSKRRPADDARLRILEAAERLFYEQGLRAVGVDAVAEAAGVTKRTLYYHFASKEELVVAYLEARDEVTLAALRDTPSARGTRPGDRILGVFDFIAAWSATAGYRGCPFNNAVAEQGTSAKVTAIARRHKTTVQRWFAELAGQGGAAEADALGAQLLVLLDGALNGAAVFGSPQSALAATQMAEVLLDAAGVARSRPARVKGKRR